MCPIQGRRPVRACLAEGASYRANDTQGQAAADPIYATGIMINCNALLRALAIYSCTYAGLDRREWQISIRKMLQACCSSAL